MMQQTIHLLPKVPEIEKLREKYDSFYGKFKTHITLVYVFNVKNQKELASHIMKSIAGIKPFEVICGKFYASNKYVCLQIPSKECRQLYKNLNKGILSGFKNKEVKFQPHISIAVLDSPKKAKELEEKLNKNPIAAKILLNAVHLLTLNKDLSIKSKKTFKLE